MKNPTRRHALIGYAFLLPNIIGFLLFTFGPIVFSFFVSFFDWNLFSTPTFVDTANYKTMFTSPEVQVRLDRQSAILAGERGGILQMVSTKDGQKLAEYKLDVPPLFDGMIAANEKLFIATMDGSVVCLEGK